MRRFLALCLSILPILALQPVTAYGEDRAYDVIIVGAGSGGTAAAIQAARSGASVALVEETGWVGGQITAAAVSTMDDVTYNRSGIYLEFIQRIRDSYGATGTSSNVCYWGTDTIAAEPVVAEAILLDMLSTAKPGKVDLYLHQEVIKAIMDGDNVKGVTFRDKKGQETTIKGKVTIDATECGDFIPLTPARYRSGNSVSPNINLDGEIQDITWVAVIREQNNIGPELMAKEPEGYGRDVGRFRKVVRLDGSPWPESYPFDIPSFKAYRGLPDRENPNPIDGGNSETWKWITRTGLNWGNDVPGNGGDHTGLTARYLEDRDYRRLINGEAVNRTLRLIRYLQTELGMTNWTVDLSQGYANRGDSVRERAIVLDDGNDGLLDHFPPIPYVRESRRIVGIETLTAKSSARSPQLGRALVNRTNSIALGEYPMDIHGSRQRGSLESDLNETIEDYPSHWRSDEGVFQVPYGTLIPEKVDGLLAAEKNLSVSRLANGATRLQPITLLTGQAAGATAALSARYGLQPRDLPVILVQDEILKGKSRISLYAFHDLGLDHRHWRGVQAATLYGFLEPMSPRMFGAILPMEEFQVMDMLAKAFGKNYHSEATNFVSRSELVRLIKVNFPDWDESRTPWDGPMETMVYRGEAVTAVWDSIVQSVTPSPFK